MSFQVCLIHEISFLNKSGQMVVEGCPRHERRSYIASFMCWTITSAATNTCLLVVKSIFYRSKDLSTISQSCYISLKKNIAMSMEKIIKET